MRSVMVWAARAAWLALALTLAPALEQATDHRSRAIQVTVATAAWVVWGVVVLAMLVATTVSLTVWRALAPLAVVTAVIAWVAGGSPAAGAVAAASAALSVLLAFSADVGEAFVQGSAYGAERRFPLRLPGPMLLVVPLGWAVVATALVTGTLLTASRQWIAGVALAAIGVALSAPLGRRLHRFSRRWLVVVPTGVVVHDPVSLAETLMVPTAGVAAAGLALTGTEAADLSGVALGPAVELRFREPVTVVFPEPRTRTTKAIHALAVLVSPSRPGRVLAALGQTGITIGS